MHISGDGIPFCIEYSGEDRFACVGFQFEIGQLMPENDEVASFVYRHSCSEFLKLLISTPSFVDSELRDQMLSAAVPRGLVPIVA